MAETGDSQTKVNCVCFGTPEVEEVVVVWLGGVRGRVTKEVDLVGVTGGAEADAGWVADEAEGSAG